MAESAVLLAKQAELCNERGPAGKTGPAASGSLQASADGNFKLRWFRDKGMNLEG